MIREIQDVIADLNNELLANGLEEFEFPTLPFTMESDGQQTLIKFLGIVVWDDDNDDRPYLDDDSTKVPLGAFLSYQCNTLLDMLSSVRMTTFLN